jgi:ABC-type lipoprotein export system ATPase subunit
MFIEPTTQNDPWIVDVQNVEKEYANGDSNIAVLRGISFQVKRGEFLSIVGPSGNGKSTLLNMITGIDRPTCGAVIVTGHPVHNMSEDALAGWRANHVGIIFQFFQLLPGLTLLDNVRLPMDLTRQSNPKARRERAECLLAQVGLSDQMQKLPGQISGGQQQRAAIARALANDPPLIVADEPTGNLDSHTAQEMFALFSMIVAQGKTVLIVTHDKSLAARIPRSVEIIDGKIARDDRRN